MVGVDELKSYLGLGPEDEVEDALLESLEREELATLEQRTNRYFGPVVEIVEILSARGFHRGRFRHENEPHRGSPRLHLKAPIVSLTSVEVLGAATFIGGSGWTQPWQASAFETDENRVSLVDGSVFPAGVRNIRVTYQGGYTAGNEPADIRGAIKHRVAERYHGRPHVNNAKAVSPAAASPAAAVEAAWRRSPGL